MNNYWNHEPEFFWYKTEKKSGIFDSEVRPPPRVDFFVKNRKYSICQQELNELQLFAGL